MSEHKQIKLRPFQKKVRNLVLEGKNVILQAPTGSGKTRGAQEPYIRNLRARGSALPLSCLYATPLRTLTTQFYQDSVDMIQRVDKKHGTDYTRQLQRIGKQAVSIQTGEQPDDPQFESLITYCTIDQLLASFLGIPYGMGRRRANLNVAAVASSYLILDEFHLYPLLLEGESCFGARTTTLAMLHMLKGMTPFVLMTATFSSSLLTRLAHILGATTVQITDEDLPLIEAGRQRLITVSPTSMSAEAILEQHEQCSLVICNTVLRAQQRYWELRDLARSRGIELVLLHSRLTDEDRARRSQFVLEELGPAHWNKHGHYTNPKNIIVVATQVVEVGLDISVQRLHTEIAPASSLIQRAGRCARYAQQHGEVIVYPLPKKAGGEEPVSSRPYDPDLCSATLAALQARDSTIPMDFRAEQDLIDVVHTREDMLLLDRFSRRREAILDDIFQSLKEHSTSVISSLIRQVKHVQVLIHNDPDEIKTRPWEYQIFSVHPDSLAAALSAFEAKRAVLGLEWTCRKAVANQQDLAGEPDSRQELTYSWVSIPYIQDQHAYATELQNTLVLAVPNELATYHPELGFLLRDDRLPVSPWPAYQSPVRMLTKRPRLAFQPCVEQSYSEHIGGLIQAYNQGIAARMQYMTRRLENQLPLPEGSIDRAIRLAIACHDLGKLSISWQEWAWNWQEALYKEIFQTEYQREEPFFFAKTDYDSGDPRQRELQSAVQKAQGRRPTHACESVVIGSTFLARSLEVSGPQSPTLPLWRATCAAIAHHHTATASAAGAVQLKPGSLESIQQALKLAFHDRSNQYDLASLRTHPCQSMELISDGHSDVLTIPNRKTGNEMETWLYFLMVRALRLSDQRADDFRMR